MLAIGNPLGFTSTVTAGIVSAKGRAIDIIQDEDRERTGGSYAIENFIQTDAVINQGNSGGPLVNLKGQVIGINTAIATGTGFYAGYGFAVPINLARKIMNNLIERGYVVRAFLGIGMNPVDEDIADRFGLDRPRGVLINQVTDGTPADKAGLKMLDILFRIDGKEMNQSNEVQNYIALKNPGDVVTLTVLRDSKEREIRVKLGERETGRVRTDTDDVDKEFSELGLEVENLKREYRLEFGYDADDEGVLVVKVEPYSVAYEKGIRRGHLITRIEDYSIKSVSDYRRAIRKFKKDEVVIFYMKDSDMDFRLFVRLPK